MANLLYDQHVHSSYSRDSKEDILNYIKKAMEFGFNYFITTEHIDFDVCETKDDWLVDFDSLKKTLKSYQSRYPSIQLLLGVELGYREDHLDKMKEVLRINSFDLVNLSIHSSKIEDFYYKEYFMQYGIEYTLDNYFKEMLEAVSTFNDFDVLSHLDYAIKTVYKINNKDLLNEYSDIIKKVMTELVIHNKALEINTKVQNAFKETTHLQNLLMLYKEVGGTKLTLSSDAHTVDRYAQGFEYYSDIIKQCGFSYLCYYIKRKEYHFMI